MTAPTPSHLGLVVGGLILGVAFGLLVRGEYLTALLLTALAVVMIQSSS